MSKAEFDKNFGHCRNMMAFFQELKKLEGIFESASDAARYLETVDARKRAFQEELTAAQVAYNEVIKKAEVAKKDIGELYKKHREACGRFDVEYKNRLDEKYKAPIAQATEDLKSLNIEKANIKKGIEAVRKERDDLFEERRGLKATVSRLEKQIEDIKSMVA